MLKLLTILVCLISFQCIAQNNVQIIIRDFNSDGFVDTIKSYNESGSGFGGKFLDITDGKTNEKYELNTYGCFCQIKNTILIPQELKEARNAPFRDAMKGKILPKERNTPEASLQWIINSTYANKKLNNNKYFDLIIDPQIKWNNTEFEYPYTYYIQMNGDTLNKLYNSNKDTAECIDQKDNSGFLINYGHNHYGYHSKDSLNLADTNDSYRIYKTSHGVIAKKGHLHKWLFISDIDLTGVPEKLRWESISRAELSDKYLLVQQSLSPANNNNIYLVNIETGLCGRFKLYSNEEGSINSDETNSFRIQEGSIYFSIAGKQISYRLDDIYNEFEKQYINK